MRGRTFLAYEAGGQQPPVQFLSGRGVLVPAQLLAVDAQHGLDRQGRRKGARRALR